MRNIHRISTLFLFLPLILLAPLSGASQTTCFEFEDMLADWQDQPPSVPTTNRAMAVEIMQWGRSEYLFLNDGNGLRIWNIDDPLQPVEGDTERLACFGGCLTSPPADYDWVLQNLSVCDHCRYGVAQLWVAGTIIFDLGEEQEPSFSDAALYEASNDVQGAFTFKHNGQQYIISNQLLEVCGAGDSAGMAALYKLDGVNPQDLTHLQCIEIGEGLSIPVMNGLYLRGIDGEAYVYLIERATFRVHLFELTGSGDNLELSYRGQPLVGYSRFGTGMRVDEASGLLITAVAGTPAVRLYDISDPGQPIRLDADFDSHLGGTLVTRAAISYPYVWIARAAGKEAFTFDISDPLNPVPIDQPFWAPQQEWNSHQYLANMDGIFSSDGQALYLARYSVAEIISNSTCAATVPPTAHLEITPGIAFPGDTVNVRSTSTGIIEGRAIWITDADGLVVAGSDQLTAQIDPLQLTIPLDLALSQSYTAHVAVENSGFPFDPDTPGDQLVSQEIVIDRSPQLSIALAPDTAIAGDTLTLTATVEGTAEELQWQIVPPTQQPWQEQGQGTVTVALSESGEWRFELQAVYQHEAQQGGQYTATTSETRSYSSVAAAFVISPTAPCVEEAVVFDASSTEAQAGADLHYVWEVGAETLSCDASEASCTIPADSFEPGTYLVTLTVTNQLNGDVSVSTQQVILRDCTPELSITATPSNPEIGQTVVFLISGADGLIEEVHWDLGGAGCDQYTRLATCVPGVLGCENHVHKYSSAGVKEVSANVLVGNHWYTVGPTTVTVQNQGSCDAQPCTSVINPLTSSFNRSGGSGAFSVRPTRQDCAWIATSNAGWIHILDGSGTGDGTVRFTVAANPGAERLSTISVGGADHFVNQSASDEVTVDFGISNSNPSIGEEIVLIAFPGLTPQSWDLGGASCDSDETTVTCSNAATCQVVTWSYQEPGRKVITLVTAEGTATNHIYVGSSGACGCDLTEAPSAAFSISASDVVVNSSVSFTANDSSADSYQWLIMQGGVAVTTGVGQSLTYTFSEMGSYVVKLTVANCAGSNMASTLINVGPLPAIVIPGLAATAGINNTQWLSDTWFFNPYDEAMTVDVRVLLDSSASSGPLQLALPPKTTRLGSSLVSGIEGVYGLLVETQGTMAPVITARTYNQTPTGTYGQLVPPVRVTGYPTFTTFIPGLKHNAQARTNLVLVNPNDTPVTGVDIRVLDAAGDQLGSYAVPEIAGYDTVVVSRVPEHCGISQNLDLLTLEVYAGRQQELVLLASVVDAVTGDAETHMPERAVRDRLVVPGIAHQAGLNGTVWVSDVTFFNSGFVPLEAKVDIYLEGYGVYERVNLALDPKESVSYPDILASRIPASMNGAKGFLLVTRAGDESLPLVSARTYLQAGASGTYGQGLAAFSGSELLGRGDLGYITGVRYTPGNEGGFRSNLGIVNAATGGQVSVRVDLLAGLVGSPSARVQLAGGEQRQFDLFKLLGLENHPDAIDEASVLLTVEGDGQVAAYVSVIDNNSNDPVLLRCQKGQ